MKKNRPSTIKNQPSSVVLYTTADGRVTVDVFFARDNFWMTQKTMAELFGVKVPAVNKHLTNIFATGELVEDSVVSILETTANDGKNYSTRFYNLDAVIAVGYRVNSIKATHFRVWATNTLRGLKALLPYHAEQVKCICIDPPYNTGEENWFYNAA